MDTERIIEQCAAGDRVAMAGLYRAYSPRMLRLIMRYVNDPAAAQDILHDGFIVILSHISEVRVPAKLEYWMGTIMKNLAIQYLSRIEIAELLDGDDEPIDSPEMDDILSYDELEIIINKLPEGYRRIFKLAVFENKSHKEIGEMLGIAPHSSSSQLARAKAMLRRLIAERQAAIGIGALMIVAATALLFTGRLLTKSMPMAMAVEESSVTETDIMAETPSKKIICDSTGYYASNVKVVKSASLQLHSVKSAEADCKTAESEGGHFSSVAVSVAGVTNDITAENEEGISSEEILNNYVRTDDSTENSNIIASAVDPVDEYLEPVGFKLSSSRKWSVGVNYDIRSLHLDHSENNNDDFMSNLPEFENPKDPDSHPKNTVSRSGGVQTTEIHHIMPITIGMSLSHQLNQRLGIETGLNLTYARSEVTEKTHGRITSERIAKTYYIGVPVKMNYMIATYHPIGVYGSCGVAIDIPVIHSAHVVRRREDYEDPWIQFSVSGGLGIEYRLSPSMSIYAEPSVRYYPDNGSSYSTYRSEHPWEISVPVGIRFKL